jgi:hypothetical protein
VPGSGFAAVAAEVASRPEVLVAVPPPLQGLVAEVQDARFWQWVADNTPEQGARLIRGRRGREPGCRVTARSPQESRGPIRLPR